MALLLVACLGYASGAWTPHSMPQVGGAVAKPPYVRVTRPDPDGIGVSYMGREIAQVMGHFAAGWLDRAERDAEEKPKLLLDSLELKPGMVIADIGAGSGYFTIPMAQRVGPTGTVYAVDIQREMLHLVMKKSRDANLRNVKPILGATTDPKVPANSTDLMLLVDVYHEFDRPYEMTQAMVRGLKPGGKLVFVEYRGEDPSVPIKPLHKMTEAQLRKEMAIHPLKWEKTIDVLPVQHIIVFRRPK
ncbi:MAG: class I SAM-dependent methyltransferase [Fimbriimonadaceae bacterium]|nr:class I SAM-dependent methyltransferase [Fimbriimonadaceae bacterium]